MMQYTVYCKVPSWLKTTTSRRGGRGCSTERNKRCKGARRAAHPLVVLLSVQYLRSPVHQSPSVPLGGASTTKFYLSCHGHQCPDATLTSGPKKIKMKKPRQGLLRRLEPRISSSKMPQTRRCNPDLKSYWKPGGRHYRRVTQPPPPDAFPPHLLCDRTLRQLGGSPQQPGVEDLKRCGLAERAGRANSGPCRRL